MADRVSSVIRVLQEAGFRGDRLKTAFGIVMRESGGNPKAHNPNRSTGDDSYGLFQLNMLGSLGPARRRAFGISSNEQLYDPLTNARAAFKLSRGGKDFGPWGIGPNAYRQGAGYSTISRFVDQFPGAPPSVRAGEAPPAAAATAGARPGATLGPELALALINASRERRGVRPLVLPEFAPPLGAPAPTSTPARVSPNELVLPLTGKGTHVTAGLGWGTKTARDIMGSPGTPVGIPSAGTVLYFHPEGAQGGGSMLLRLADGREVWLGHIAQGLAGGTRFRPGQELATIARQSVSAPHAHIDVRRA